MLNYLIRRVAMAVLVLFGLLVATFFIIHLVPGDPVRAVLQGPAPPAVIAQVRHQLGLDEPLLTQFAHYVSNTFQGHFGTSFALGAPVGQIIGQRLVPSVELIAYAMVIAVLIGTPLAIWAALRPHGVVDTGIRVSTTVTFAMPAFWLGLMLALIFGLDLGWFPVAGYGGGVAGFFRTLTLPALALGLGLSAVVVRTLRSSLLEVLQSEYIEAARSRGLRDVRVVSKHAMRNSVMNTLTILTVNVGFLIGGTVVIEQVFQIPGLGTLLVSSVQKRDYQMVQALALLAGTAVVLASLTADIVQAFLDPRVRLAGR
jgi:peptide/nickel transport system permease protein